MNPGAESTHSPADAAAEVTGWTVGLGMIVLALFPLAIPFLALTAVALLPFLVVPLAGALVVAVLAVPVLVVRGVVRRMTGRSRPTREPKRADSTTPLAGGLR